MSNVERSAGARARRPIGFVVLFAVLAMLIVWAVSGRDDFGLGAAAPSPPAVELFDALAPAETHEISEAGPTDAVDRNPERAPADASAIPWTVRGRVVEWGTGDPVGGAEIALFTLERSLDDHTCTTPRSEPLPSRVVACDGDGHFAFDAPDPSLLRVEVRAQAHAVQSFSCVVPRSKAGRELELAAFAVRRTQSLRLSILTKRGAPRAGDAVELTQLPSLADCTGSFPWSARARTNQLGAIDLLVPVGSSLNVVAIGPDRLDVRETLTWERLVGGELIELRANGFGTVSGTIHCAGAPLAGEVVRSSGSLASSRTDHAGRFELPCVEEGEVLVSIGPPRERDPVLIEVRDGETTTLDLNLPVRGHERVAGMLTLDGVAPRRAWLRATAALENGAPLSGATVSEATTDALGQFELEGLFSGAVEIEARVLTARGTLLRSVQVVDLSANSMTRLDLELRTGSLRGSVRAAGSGELLRGVEVVLLRKSERGWVLEHSPSDGNFVLAADGNFAADELSWGEYRVACIDPLDGAEFATSAAVQIGPGGEAAWAEVVIP